jgi:hypothetical protein
MTEADFEKLLADEFYGPSVAMMPLFLRMKTDTERFHRANEAMMADILGADPVMPPPSDAAPEVVDLMYALQAIYSCVQKFKTFEMMFRYYPWRGKISKKDHLESAFYLFAHETYIFEERLKVFFNAVNLFARYKSISLEVDRVRKSILKAHRLAFGSIVRMRGVHVHEDDTTPREIRRVAILQTLQVTGIPKYSLLYQQALRDARRRWIANCETADKMAHEIARSAFNLTKPAWSRISEDYQLL